MRAKKESPFPDKFDSLSRHGAKLLSHYIADHWAARGFSNVVVWGVAIPDSTAYGIKSNLVNGLPPGRKRGL